MLPNRYAGQPSKADYIGGWPRFGASPYQNIEDEDDDEYKDDFCSAVAFTLFPGAPGVIDAPTGVDPLQPCRRRFRGVRTNLG